MDNGSCIAIKSPLSRSVDGDYPGIQEGSAHGVPQTTGWKHSPSQDGYS